jgi:hypothetical protein
MSWISNAWEVFLLFLIPIGGGIPAGVLLAKSRAIEWPAMIVLYFLSDVVLACLFEPIMKLILLVGKRSPFMTRFNEAFKKSLNKTISRYGMSMGPFSLIMLSFGADPMTGRAAALAGGHHFVSAWTFAILGDMIFFIVLMISTLCLNNILGDGTWTAVIIMVAMIAIPAFIRRIRGWWRARGGRIA